MNFPQSEDLDLDQLHDIPCQSENKKTVESHGDNNKNTNVIKGEFKYNANKQLRSAASSCQTPLIIQHQSKKHFISDKLDPKNNIIETINVKTQRNEKEENDVEEIFRSLEKAKLARDNENLKIQDGAQQ